MFSVRICILFFCILILTLVRSVGAGEVDWGLGRLWPVLASQDHVWVGTTGGLYRYDISDDDWLTFTPREGLCDWVPRLLGLDQGILWVGTSGGLCNADVQLFDWDVLDTTRGLPSSQVLSLAFDEDYVWVGTEGGVARYDPLSEELEIFAGDDTPSGVRVNDIAVEGETVWLATDEGVWEFSSEYETWRVYTEAQGLIARQVDRIIAGSGTLWFLTDAGLTRFDTASRTWYEYQISGVTKVNDVALDGANVWLATDQGVFFYDTALDQWREFQELQSLAVRKVNGITLAQGQIWVATEIGVGRFDEAAKTWTLYTVENGLSSNQVRTIEFWGQILFVTSEGNIDYYKVNEDRWYSQPVEAPRLTEVGRGGPVVSLGGPEGTLFRPTSTVIVRLLGRASYQYDRTDEDILGGDEPAASVEEIRGRTDVVLAASLGNDRAANAFYDDTRLEQEEEYGLRYRGAEADLLQELFLGDMRWNMGRGEMLPTVGLFGGGVRMETGARTSRLRRRRLALSLAGGDQTTDFQTDFFTGSSQTVSGSLEDRMYLKRRFYSLVEEPSALFIRPGSDRIYLDDRLEATNTANTQRNRSVAGVIGDFDLLHPVEDYALDYRSGLLDLYHPPCDSAVVVAVFELEGQDGGGREVVLYGDGVDVSLVNRYSLAATEILPQTLFLTILDTLGFQHSLSDFGLDSNGDGAVDGQFVDFHHGILYFPTPRPFPDSVYLSEAPQHLFTIQFRYQTFSTTLQLSRRDLVSESERVVVDGQMLRRGEDYIVLYPSGILHFLREGLMESGSRVEVEYEYHRQSEDRFHTLGASYSPSDVLSAALSAVRYYPQEQDSSLGRVDLVHATGELRLDEGLAGLDLLVISEAARSATSQVKGSAARIRASAKSDRLRLTAELEDYDQEFHSVSPRRTVLGQLIQRSAVEGQYELPKLFILDAGWTSEQSLDDEGRKVDEQRYQTRGVLNRRGYPTVVVAATQLVSGEASPFPDQTSLRGDLEYQFPDKISRAMRLHSLKILSYLHRTWEQGVDSTYNPASRKAIRQGEYVRLDVAPKPAFQMAGSFRRDWRRIQSSNLQSEYTPVEETGEAIFTTNCDEIHGLSLYARLEGNSRENMLSGVDGLRAYSLDRQRQVIARIYPGFWQRILTPLTLEMDYVHRWDGELAGLSKELGFWERYWSRFTGGEVVAGEDFQSKQIRGEVRPSSALSLNMGVERQERDRRQLWSVLQNRVWKYSSKLELRRSSSVLVLSFLRDESEDVDISTRIKDAPSLWWERRWSVGFITKASLFFWRESHREGKLLETSRAISPRLGITGRWLRLGFLGAVEVVDDLSLTLSRMNMEGAKTLTRILANSLKLDIRPLPISLLRLQSQLSYTDNEDAPDVLSHSISLKLTAQF